MIYANTSEGRELKGAEGLDSRWIKEDGTPREALTADRLRADGEKGGLGAKLGGVTH